MRLAISNIAWDLEDDTQVAEIMERHNVSGVEVAPTKIWPTPLSVDISEIQRYKAFWNTRNISIVAMQALLFGRPDLTIFENESARDETFRYLTKMISLGARLGAGILVFGSPKNRKINNLPRNEAMEIAVDFFRRLAKVAMEHEICFCIEPNPTVYDCDFITNSQEGIDLVNNVSHDGFGLHLDAAAMFLSNESIKAVLPGLTPLIRHFHISEPELARIGTTAIEHLSFAEALGSSDYRHWVSIEMRSTATDTTFHHVDTAIQEATKSYGRYFS